LKRAEIITFCLKNPVFFLASHGIDNVHVRALMLLKADETGLYFSTWQHKEVYRQITVNPLVEVCFYDPLQGRQIRISGRVEEMSSEAFREEVFSKFRFLQNRPAESMKVFCLRNGSATSWSILNPFEPKTVFEF